MITILFEDNHLLAALKPAGVATQDEPNAVAGFETFLKAFIKERDKKPGNVFLHALHRLDKPVAGIVLFAKSQKALSRCNESQREGLWTKVYEAEVEGITDLKAGQKIGHYLLKTHEKSIATSHSQPDAKWSELGVLAVEARRATTLLTLQLITGRHHQIRAQCAALKHPILGDRLYGSTFVQNNNTQINHSIALRHTKLTLPHPIKSFDQEFLTIYVDN